MLFPPPVSSLPKSKLLSRIGNSLLGNASSTGFLIALCRLGLILAPAGEEGRRMPKEKGVSKLGAPGILFALLICGAIKLCDRACPLLNGLPVLGGRPRGERVASQGRTGRQGSVTRRMLGGLRGEDG